MPRALPAGTKSADLSAAPVQPFKITTFYTPVFEGGAIGQPVPYSVEVSGMPTKELQEELMGYLMGASDQFLKKKGFNPPRPAADPKNEPRAMKITVAGQASSEFLAAISKNKPGPLEMTTSFQPVDAKGAMGRQDYPVTISIPSEVPREMQAKIVDRMASVSRLLENQPLTTDQKVDRILELLPCCYTSSIQPPPSGPSPDQVRDEKMDKILDRLQKLEEKINAQVPRQ